MLDNVYNNFPENELVEMLSLYIKDEMIGRVMEECANFLGISEAVTLLEGIDSPMWWIAVKDLSPTVLFKCAINNNTFWFGELCKGITLHDLPSHIKPLFPPVKKEREDITQTLRRLGHEFN